MLSLSRFTAVTGLLTAICAAPLSGQAANASDRVQYVKVIARDYVYDAPASVQAGIAVIHLLNQGTDAHQIDVQELPEGRSVKEFFDATRNLGHPPTWSRSLGQTTTILNGGEAFLALRLPPGRYILSCLIPARDGRSHVAKGMYQLITATGPTPARKP